MEKQIKELEAMLVVIYKKLDDLERKLNGNGRSAPLKWYLEELRAQALKVKDDLQ